MMRIVLPLHGKPDSGIVSRSDNWPYLGRAENRLALVQELLKAWERLLSGFALDLLYQSMKRLLILLQSD